MTVTLTLGTPAASGWHLLGNPFPAPLDWSLVTPPAAIGAAMYVFESSAQYAGTYRSYINGIGDPIIPSGQGFFVRKASGAGTGTPLTLPAAARVTEFSASASTFRRRAADTRPLVQLSLRSTAPGSLPDATTVYFEAGATPAAEAAFDAPKLLNPGTASLFTLAGSTERLAINGLNLSPGTALTVPLGLVLPTAGPYTLTADLLRHLAPASLANVALLDRRTGRQTPLTQPGAAYTFQITPTELTSLGRFALLFNPSATALAGTAPALAQQIGLYPNPAHGRFTLSLPALPGTAAVQVSLRNALGQSVLAPCTLPLTASGAITGFDTNTLAPGVYLLQLSAEGLAPVTKRIVLE